MGAADYPRAAYSADFETKGTMTSVQEIVQLSAVAVIGEARETVAILAEPLIRKLLTGQGVPEDKIRAALDALEESGKKEPKPEPAPAPFGQPKLEIEPDDEDEGGPDAA
jgi:hypothetical protein